MVRMLLWVYVTLNLGIGFGCLVDPVGLLAPLAVEAADNRGIIELRAMYGGLQIGVGLFLAWCALHPERVRLGLLAATLEIGGLGLTRLASYLVMSADGWLTPFLCVVEVTITVISAATLWVTRTQQ